MSSGVRREVLSYDAERFPFAREVTAMAGGDLSLVHQQDWATGELEQALHANFHRLLPCYESFVYEVVRELVDSDGPLCFQAEPTFRVHRPGQMAVHEFHVDTKYHHQREVLNIWVPLTPGWGTNTVWVEETPGAADYTPVELDVGQMLCFHATRLAHGNLPNTTGRTRVSFDLRVIPQKEFRPSGLSTVNRHVPIDLGCYYALMHPDGRVDHRPPAEGKCS